MKVKLNNYVKLLRIFRGIQKMFFSYVSSLVYGDFKKLIDTGKRKVSTRGERCERRMKRVKKVNYMGDQRRLDFGW